MDPPGELLGTYGVMPGGIPGLAGGEDFGPVLGDVHTQRRATYEAWGYEWLGEVLRFSDAPLCDVLILWLHQGSPPDEERTLIVKASEALLDAGRTQQLPRLLGAGHCRLIRRGTATRHAPGGRGR
jgi:hypothetical protein